MENKLEYKIEKESIVFDYPRSESQTQEFEPGIKIKSKEVFQSSKEYPTDELSGVYFDGTQYFDFKNVLFVNHTTMAKLINLLKIQLKQGVKIKLVNVTESIRGKIKSMGLENIFNFW